jgi:CubicO group peptidase (beta-lactamase class C family)
MKVYKVSALSVAVVDDFKIIELKAYGASPTTLFQAGSISKPVAAAGALYLVEHGKLSLDEDVNKKLKTWKVPENEFTKTERVTLRRLMSHTAGLAVHGFPGYDVDEPVPTLVQIFKWRETGEYPTHSSRYYAGKPFPALMRELVLGPIGMDHSSYEQPLPPALAAQTATGTRSDGTPIHGRWHVYPEMAAAGLWTTPTDLCKFGLP